MYRNAKYLFHIWNMYTICYYIVNIRGEDRAAEWASLFWRSVRCFFWCAFCRSPGFGIRPRRAPGAARFCWATDVSFTVCWCFRRPCVMTITRILMPRVIRVLWLAFMVAFSSLPAAGAPKKSRAQELREAYLYPAIDNSGSLYDLSKKFAGIGGLPYFFWC